MAKRIYAESIKKWLIGVGITGGTLIGAYFYYLMVIGVIDVEYYSGDSVCAGTEEDPCYAYIDFCVIDKPVTNEDIFIYPIGYDPWGRNSSFDFDPAVKSWKFTSVKLLTKLTSLLKSPKVTAV